MIPQVKDQKVTPLSQIFYKHKNKLITSIAIIILGVAIALLIHDGLKHNFNSACFITSAILTPLILGVGSFSIYRLIIDVKTLEQRRSIPIKSSLSDKKDVEASNDLLFDKLETEPNFENETFKTSSNQELLCKEKEEEVSLGSSFEQIDIHNQFENSTDSKTVSLPSELQCKETTESLSFEENNFQDKENVNTNRESLLVSQTKPKKLPRKDFFNFLPNVLIIWICDCLYIREINKLSLINKKTLIDTKNAKVKRAQKYGYIGNSKNGESKYLKNLSKLMYILVMQNIIPEQYFIRRERYLPGPFNNNIDFEATFINLKSSKEKREIFQTLLDENLINFTRKEKPLSSLKLLLLFGANPNKCQDDDTFIVLHYAAFLWNFELVNLLLKYKSEINRQNKTGCTPLHLTLKDPLGGWSQNQKMSIEKTVEILVISKANLHIPTANGCFPLHLAARNGYSEVMSLLLDHGAHVNELDGARNTALCLTLGMGNRYVNLDIRQESVRTLVIKNANPNLSSANGHLPLHFAVQHGCSEIVSLLLEHKAHVNELDRAGNTALCFALGASNEPVRPEWTIKKSIKVLLMAHADPNITTTTGKTPLDYASLQGYSEITSLLLEHRA